jgi:hypothetical protein
LSGLLSCLTGYGRSGDQWHTRLQGDTERSTSPPWILITKKKNFVKSFEADFSIVPKQKEKKHGNMVPIRLDFRENLNLKGLSHEIDFKNFDKNLQQLTYLWDAAAF